MSVSELRQEPDRRPMTTPAGGASVTPPATCSEGAVRKSAGPRRPQATLPTRSVRELAHRFDANRQRGEIRGAGGSHVRECSLPVGELFAE